MAEACIFQFGLPVKGMEEEGKGDTRMKPMTLRLPDDLYQALVFQAGKSRRSLNGEIVYQLDLALMGEDGVPRDTVVIPPSHPPETKMISPPLDAEGIPVGSKKGKVTWQHVTSGRNRGFAVGVPGSEESPERAEFLRGATVTLLSCTCGAGERAKGKHSRWCPMRGK
jgi:hypothetical protein